ncbi:hypothetical protein NIES2107_25890 [Nostoc carneum NIES-2107]|nr:hypothetical protein NIES2107_25890 [Nostoc carneum NIES-2107]
MIAGNPGSKLLSNKNPVVTTGFLLGYVPALFGIGLQYSCLSDNDYNGSFDDSGKLLEFLTLIG